MNKVWFITGTSRGIGRAFAESALERGDKVAATARDTATLDDLVVKYGDAILPLLLDVTDKAAVDSAVAAAHEQFGHLDVVVNNAGYGLFGTIEETSQEQARAQMETNFFGALWVTQAVLPILRAQGSGHIIQISSVGGIAAFPTIGVYNASKWALEALSESLSHELTIAGTGIRITIVEPGGFTTDWAARPQSTPSGSPRTTRSVRPSRLRWVTPATPTRATRAPPCCRSSTRRTRRCGCSSARTASRSPRTSTPTA